MEAFNVLNATIAVKKKKKDEPCRICYGLKKEN